MIKNKWVQYSLAFVLGLGIGLIIPINEPGDVKVQLPDGSFAKAPAGSTVSITATDDSIDYTIPNNVIEQGTAHGIGVKTWANKIDENLNLSSPEVKFSDDFYGMAGKTGYKAKLLASSGANVIIVIGIILIVAGVVVLIWLKMTTLGIALIAAGLLVIGVAVMYEKYPWMLALGVVAVVAVIGYFIYKTYFAKTAGITATTLIEAIESAGIISPTELDIPIGISTENTKLIMEATVDHIKSHVKEYSKRTGGVVSKFVDKVLGN